MGDTSVLIGVRVLTENEGRNVFKVKRDEAVRKTLGELEGVLALGNPETLGDFRRIGTEDGVRVNRTEAQ